ncbi:PoNe immunity protein domain-containing protein [Cupriavidus plantarum]|nr:PoNe immunity protein domain-containing protein [Cupriavidus plantarum]
MRAADFKNIRRQKFLPEKYFGLNAADLARQIEDALGALERDRSKGILEPVSQHLILIVRLHILTLMYTGGAPIESLMPLYGDVIDAAEALAAGEREYFAYLGRKSGEDLIDNASPLPLGDFESYRTAIDIVSLGILLGDGDGLRRFVKLLDIDRGRDMLFEAIIETAVDDPSDNNEFLHVRPYEPLLDAFCTAETPAEEAAYMKTFLDSWYKSFETLPWHNGHLKVPADESYLPYYGYWAFEAAAVSVLFNIDDTPFRDHLLYPKDLADWARANHSKP